MMHNPQVQMSSRALAIVVSCPTINRYRAAIQESHSQLPGEFHIAAPRKEIAEKELTPQYGEGVVKPVHLSDSALLSRKSWIPVMKDSVDCSKRAGHFWCEHLAVFFL